MACKEGVGVKLIMVPPFTVPMIWLIVLSLIYAKRNAYRRLLNISQCTTKNDEKNK
jgi:hypothetical protein